MKKSQIAVLVSGILLAGCATRTPTPTSTNVQRSATHAATPVTTTEVPTATPTYAATSTPTATATPEPTNTPTPVPTYTLSGTVFFDYNGNGLRDEGEPPIEGVPIRVAGLSTTSAPDGSYLVTGIPAGSQQVYVESPTQDPATAFRYVNRFLGWVDIPSYELNGVGVPAQHLADTQVQLMDEPLNVWVDTSLDMDIGLMQGWMTWPFQKEEDAWLSSYVDLDYQLGGIRNFASEHRECDFEGPRVPGTCDNHQGIDWDGDVGTPILAVGPGTVIEVDGVAPNGALHLHILHRLGGRSFVSNYGHYSASTVGLGDRVSRGQAVALVGMTGTSHPHLHLGLWEVPSHFESYQVQEIFDYVYRTHAVMVPYADGGEVPAVLDAFRDVTDAGSLSYWTVDNDPRFP